MFTLHYKEPNINFAIEWDNFNLIALLFTVSPRQLILLLYNMCYCTEFIKYKMRHLKYYPWKYASQPKMFKIKIDHTINKGIKSLRRYSSVIGGFSRIYLRRIHKSY